MNAITALSLGVATLVAAFSTAIDERAHTKQTGQRPSDELIMLAKTEIGMRPHPYVGMWITSDGQMRPAANARAPIRAVMK